MKKIEIDDLIFKKIIQGVKHSLALDDSRPILKYIQLKYDGKLLIATALDGFRASRIKFNLESDSEPFECFIKPITIKPLKKGVNNVVVEVVDDVANLYVKTEYGELHYCFKQPSEKYIDVDKIFKENDEHDREMTIRARFIKEALASIQTTDLNGVAVIEMKPDTNKPLIIKSSTRDGIINEQLILPMRTFNREE